MYSYFTEKLREGKVQGDFMWIFADFLYANKNWQLNALPY